MPSTLGMGLGMQSRPIPASFWFSLTNCPALGRCFKSLKVAGALGAATTGDAGEHLVQDPG